MIVSSVLAVYADDDQILLKVRRFSPSNDSLCIVLLKAIVGNQLDCIDKCDNLYRKYMASVILEFSE